MIERYILGRIVNCEGDTNHFEYDNWIELSIKDCEREDRDSLREKTIRLEISLKE